MQTIPLVYEADNTFEARLLMSDLVWFEDKLRWREGSIFFVSRQQAPGINVDVQAIVGKHAEGEKTIFIFSIRGSESQVDWINNLRFRLVPFLEAETEADENSEDREPVPKVHKGFLRYARELFRSWRAGVLLDEAIELEERGEPYEIWISGHSLGGAVGIVLGALLQEELQIPAEKIQVVTFGAPSPANDAFVERYATQTIQANIVGDPVTLLTRAVLPQLWSGGYAADFGTTVRLTPTQAQVDRLKKLTRTLLRGEDKAEAFREIVRLSVAIHQQDYLERFAAIEIAGETSDREAKRRSRVPRKIEKRKLKNKVGKIASQAGTSLTFSIGLRCNARLRFSNNSRMASVIASTTCWGNSAKNSSLEISPLKNSLDFSNKWRMPSKPVDLTRKVEVGEFFKS